MVAWNMAGERTRLHTVLLLSSETMALMSDAVVQRLGGLLNDSARISSPYVFRRQGPKSVMCANSPWVRGARRARSQSAVRGRMTSDSTPRAPALPLRRWRRRW
jgi:hypothetical protein